MWLGWLFLLAGLYVLVVAIRGGVQLVTWFVDEYIIEPRSTTSPRQAPPEAPRTSPLAAGVRKHRKKREPAAPKKTSAQPPLQDVAASLRPSHAGGLLQRMRMLVFRGNYDFWVSTALAEDDLELKVRYLSKALALNPAYLPAWGMKGNALFDLGKYAEAERCFERSLEIHPSAVVWYRKARCCYHGGRREEALRCLDEAFKTCPSHDRQLLDDVTRMRTLVETGPQAASTP